MLNTLFWNDLYTETYIKQTYMWNYIVSKTYEYISESKNDENSAT